MTLSKGGTVLQTQTIARPAAGTSQTQTTFGGLQVDTYDVAVSAYPNADGTGVVQATGAGTMTTSVSGPAGITVSLGSTVALVELSPSSVSVTAGGATSLVASAKDSAGNLVLLSAGGGTENVVWAVRAGLYEEFRGKGAVCFPFKNAVKPKPLLECLRGLIDGGGGSGLAAAEGAARR